MKGIIGSIALTVLTMHSAVACDVCGSSSGNQGLGLLPQSAKHFAGIQYQHMAYNSVHEYLSEHKASTQSQERYTTLQVWGRYQINERWQIFGFVPYRHNTTTVANATTTGVGDMSLLANYTFIQTSDTSGRAVSHRLQGGTGIKAPTGRHQGVSELERAGIPNMQPGTGAWDIPVNANYTIRYKNTGINIDASYNMTTPNKSNYKFGNKLNSQLTWFYSWQAGNISVLPQAICRYEYSLHDYDNYDRKWLNEQTGGTILSAGVGVQAYYNKLGLHAAFTKPIAQNYSRGMVTAVSRLDVGMMFLF
jgi:hypothetical protein